jgi:DNA repair photolyase
MAEYDYTLNPYSGCAFGCSYCYAAFFTASVERRDTWGDWVDVKENALAVLRQMRAPLRGKTIYMSSVTDPYQPIERKLGLVRSLLEELVHHQPRLVVQTRSQLVTRDIDLLRRFDHVQVNMTVTTDSERVRRAFEPHCSTNRKRLDAIATVRASGIVCVITMTPLLPVEDVHTFARDLVATGVRRFVVQPFHPERGRFVAGTREPALALVRDMGWTAERYDETVNLLRHTLPELSEGQEGFAPT